MSDLSLHLCHLAVSHGVSANFVQIYLYSCATHQEFPKVMLLACLLFEQTCSTVGKCAAFCFEGPQLNSQRLQRLFRLFSDLCRCSFKYP